MILDKTYLGSTEIEKVYLGNDVVYELTPSVSNLYSWSDAGTPSPNEANAIELSTTDGWDAFQNTTVAVSSSEFTNGLYSIQGEALGGGSDQFHLNLTTESGADYRITFWAKTNVSGSGFGRIRNSSGWTPALPQQIFNTVWTEYSYDVQATGTSAYINFYATYPGGAIGDQTFVDNITIIKL